MYGMYFSFVVFCIAIYFGGGIIIIPFLYIHTCVIFNKCIQTLKKKFNCFNFVILILTSIRIFSILFIMSSHTLSINSQCNVK